MSKYLSDIDRAPRVVRSLMNFSFLYAMVLFSCEGEGKKKNLNSANLFHTESCNVPGEISLGHASAKAATPRVSSVFSNVNIIH